ncbi:MAG TPA: hypothetical protein VF762_15125, partial [Blastocatellia bacterium]
QHLSPISRRQQHAHRSIITRPNKARLCMTREPSKKSFLHFRFWQCRKRRGSRGVRGGRDSIRSIVEAGETAFGKNGKGKYFHQIMYFLHAKVIF